MNNLSVTKSNYLVDASYKLTAQAQKLVLACLAKIDSRKDVPKEITITSQAHQPTAETLTPCNP
jgi:hypothetical protein